MRRRHLCLSNVARYITEFDAGMSEEELGSPHFQVRFLFTPLVTSAKTQANEIVQFVPYNSEMGQSINQVFLKEVERPKYRANEILAVTRDEGYPGFNMHHHTQLWKAMDAKNPGKGYGVVVSNYWYWYDRWVDEVRKHCAANAELYSVDHRR